ncbi:MAG: HAMP domain-containing histidine kinase [Elusimicrobia bacterium]|nr:HAMP domain-containing histidine kinase [Elusimicrobiota bacterium]
MAPTIRTLLIEDDADSAEWIRLQLGKRGPDFEFSVASAASLAEGLARLSRRDIDAVLVDLNLNDSRGLDTLDEVLRRAPGVPVVVLTGWPGEELGLEALARGAQDFLPKDSLEPRLLRRSVAYSCERARLQARLNRMRIELQERRRSERAKEAVLGTVSHELRSPLTIIKAAVMNLRDGLAGPLNAQQGEMVALACKNGERLAHLVTDLLDLSRLESGKARIQKVPLDVRRLAQEMADGLRLADPQATVAVELDVPAAVPLAYAEPDAVMQVLTNLVNNGLRFARRRIVIRVRRAERSQGCPPGVEVTVADDGPGVPPDKKDALFNRFVQLDRRKDVTGYSGTGLGLAISRELVQSNEGRIWIESPPGKGAEFHFTLPLFINREDPQGGSNAETRGDRPAAHRAG